MPQVPLMILCDSITSNTGLARIGRDLALNIHSDPDLKDKFRVGVLGVGGTMATSSRYPFPNYSIIRLQQMCPIDIVPVWQDFAGDDKGVLLVIWNLSWLSWLAQPWTLPPDHPVRQLLLRKPDSISWDHWQAISSPSSPSFSPALLSRLADRPFQTWLYCPIDGHLPDGTLGHQLAPLLQGFDRVLGYTRYGAEVIEQTLIKWAGQSEVTTINSIPHVPHGLDRDVFYPRDRATARRTFFQRVSQGLSQLPLKDDQVLLCMTATNSSRKCWETFFSSAAELLRRGRNVFLWGHTDALQPSTPNPAVCWNLPALAKQYGMQNRCCLTTARLSDDDLAWAFSAADCMIAVSSEGWGYPAMESLGCGCPVVGTTYAGSAEFTPRELQVEPQAFVSEQPFGIGRPIFSAAAVADKVELALAGPREERAKFPESILWEKAWEEKWKPWLLKGIEQ